MRGYVVTSRSSEAVFEISATGNPRKLGDGDTVDVSGTRSTSTSAAEGRTIEWRAGIRVAEVDVTGNDPDMDNEAKEIEGRASSARDPVSETLTVGSGDCRVDLSIVVSAEPVS